MNYCEKHKVDFNVRKEAINEFSLEKKLEVFKAMCRARKFEEYIVKASQSGKFKIKIHMSSGQEAVGAAVGIYAWDYQIFTQHRAMDLYLALGGDPRSMRDEIMCLDTGSSGGKLGGGFQYMENGRNLYPHTGFIGENISVGVGAALGNHKKTICYFGDGAAEEDYALSALGFAATHKLPVLFVCTDNELSVLSGKDKRRTWELDEVARGFGMEAIDVSDDPFTVLQLLSEFETRLPALINIRVCRNYWHAGVGVDEEPAWDRFLMLKDHLLQMGAEKEVDRIIRDADEEMEEVWKKYL